MSVLSGKKILLGISGSIAAYKTPFIVRILKSFEAEVRVIMTPAAKEFVSPLTLSTLSENPVLSTFTETSNDNPVWNNRVLINGRVVKNNSSIILASNVIKKALGLSLNSKEKALESKVKKNGK